MTQQQRDIKRKLAFGEDVAAGEGVARQAVAASRPVDIVVEEPVAGAQQHLQVGEVLTEVRPPHVFEHP